MIETEGVHTAGFDEGDFRKWVESQSPLSRIGQSDDLAPTAVCLASTDSKYLTGETIRVTGGIFETKSALEASRHSRSIKSFGPPASCRSVASSHVSVVTSTHTDE